MAWYTMRSYCLLAGVALLTLLMLGWAQRAAAQVAVSNRTPTAAVTATADVVRAAGIQSLLVERADWQQRNTGFVAPLVLTMVGVVTGLTAVGMFVAYQNSGSDGVAGGLRYVYSPKEDEYSAAAIIAGVSAGLFLATGITLWALRTSGSRQQQELQRIDSQLRNLGLQVKLSPWFQLRASCSREHAGGLRLNLQF